MNSILFSITIVLIISLSNCQVPKPCITPPQWEANYRGYDSARGNSFRARISYDSVYQRERIIEEFRLGTNDTFFDIIYLHSQQIEYRFNLKSKVCQKQAITRPWIDLGINKNATSLGESYIGSSAVPKASILSTIWRHEFTDSKGESFVHLGTWTYEACIPIRSDYFSKTANVRLHSEYYDITPGFSDPNVFVPPKECL